MIWQKNLTKKHCAKMKNNKRRKKNLQKYDQSIDHILYTHIEKII